MSSPTLLTEIVDRKRRDLELAQAERPLGMLRAALGKQSPVRDFAQALRGRNVALIAEIKRASPSEGVFPLLGFDPRQIAGDFAAGGAAALSVLTEEHYFQGAPGFLARARSRMPLPVLRKDFIFDEYQVYESRVLEADAVLLIVAILEPRKLRALHGLVRELGMTALVEVHDEAEMARAGEVGAEVIGINNRNLATMTVDLRTTERLAPLAPPGALLVSESGIKVRGDVERVAAAGVDAVLVGTALMKSEQIDLAARQFVGVAKCLSQD